MNVRMEDFEYTFNGYRLCRIQYDGGRFPGRLIYKRRPSDRAIPRTENDELNQYLMDMMLEHLRPLEKYVEVGFRNGKRAPFHAALLNMKREALICDGFDKSHIIALMVSISEGNLAIGDTFEAYYDPATSEICVTWDTDASEEWEGQIPGRADDRLMVVAQDVWGTYQTYGKINGAPRSAGSERFFVDPLSDDRGYFVYVAFISADGTSQSHSICLLDQVSTEGGDDFD